MPKTPTRKDQSPPRGALKLPPRELAAETEGGPALRVFSVLEAAVSMRRPLSIPELCALCDIPKPTMHRLVRQLEGEKLLQREYPGRLRGPGPRLVEFALSVLRFWADAAPRQALLQDLSNSVGETCNLGVMEGNAIVYIDRVESKWPFGLKFEPGSRVPLHCTSMGKLFLSEMPPEKRQELLGVSTLHSYTENTICDPVTLERDLLETKRRGYSLDDQEFLAGVVCLAVPIRDASGQLAAALAISAPAARLTIKKAMQQIPVMMNTAQKLGEQISNRKQSLQQLAT